MTAAKRTRRPNGRSSVYEGADGSWHGYVTMGVKADGSLDRRHVRGATEKAVTQKVRNLEKDRDAGQVPIQFPCKFGPGPQSGGDRCGFRWRDS